LVIVEWCLERVRDFSAAHPSAPVTRLGCASSWEGTQLGQLTPTDQRDISHHMMSCPAYKVRGRRRKGWDIQSYDVCLLK